MEGLKPEVITLPFTAVKNITKNCKLLDVSSCDPPFYVMTSLKRMLEDVLVFCFETISRDSGHI